MTGERGVGERLLGLARQRLRMGDARGAVEPLRRVLSEDPNLAEAHALLACALHNTKRIFAARVECELALQLDPESVTGHLASSFVAVAERKPQLAEQHVEAAIALAPENPAGYEARARVYRLRGDRRAEREALERALSLEPEDANVLAKLGSLDLWARNYVSAEKYAQQALENEPENGEALCLKGYVHLARGEIDAARDHALWALRNGKQERALHLLAAIKARQSFVLGLWWRYSVWLSAMGEGRIATVLVGSFLVYRVAAALVQQHGLRQGAELVNYAWYGICAYSWFGPALFRRSLRRELAQIELRKDF
ncbi:MAG TPA: tetratricopeptide repeat protein [Polyangiaceae bacterium]|jgi:Tfp pilus assembly protein PilF|nr:tetratricopeptide repeat protein [Polyangiaceae bacterium]